MQDGLLQHVVVAVYSLVMGYLFGALVYVISGAFWAREHVLVRPGHALAPRMPQRSRTPTLQTGSPSPVSRQRRQRVAANRPASAPPPFGKRSVLGSRFSSRRR